MENKTEYAIGRLNNDTEVFDYIRVSEYNLTIFPADSYERASRYDNFELVRDLVSLQNQIADLLNDSYEYKIVKGDTEIVIVDENGDPV